MEIDVMENVIVRFIKGIVVMLLMSVGSAYGFTCANPPPGFGTPNVATCGNAEFQSCGVMVNGTLRHFCIHVPSDGPPAVKRNMPVVFAFHGGGGDAKVMAAIWDKHTEQGMVIVAPSALVSDSGRGCKPAWRQIGRVSSTWADLLNPDLCGLPAGPPIPPQYASPPYQHGGDRSDDLRFVKRMADSISADPQINPTGFYAAGFSNGAGMVYQLFITRESAILFDGFAAVSNVMGQEKMAAQATAAPAAAPFSNNQDIKKPFLFIIGSNEKINSPAANILESIQPGGPCAAFTNVTDVIPCWLGNPTYAGGRKHTMLTPRTQTIKWLVTHNNAVRRDIESLYPDLGHGDAAPAESDETMVVRQDFIKKANADDSEPVAALAILNGQHQWPGSVGGYPPCDLACDIEGTEVILQFWRANAGFASRWR